MAGDLLQASRGGEAERAVIRAIAAALLVLAVSGLCPPMAEPPPPPLLALQRSRRLAF